MNSLSRYAEDTIARFTAAAMKPHGGETPGSIRPRRHARYGLKHIPFRLAKVTGLLMPGKLQPVTRWIGSLEGNQRTGKTSRRKNHRKHHRSRLRSARNLELLLEHEPAGAVLETPQPRRE